ncbi:Uncharacterised protein [Mycobacterium tuberculosis]|nr:Uncharacterised protein [Mycobacterium tuberculosis]
MVYPPRAGVAAIPVAVIGANSAATIDTRACAKFATTPMPRRRPAYRLRRHASRAGLAEQQASKPAGPAGSAGPRGAPGAARASVAPIAAVADQLRIATITAFAAGTAGGAGAADATA